MNSFINYLDKYHSQLTVILIGLSLIVLAVFLWVWFYNRRKYNHLKHQIPASVVKNYLDSIIQNSTALKSSLFRGGGLEVDSNGVPSVMPLSDLPGGAEVNISGSMDDSALKAEISKLQAQLSERNSTIKDFENKTADLSGQVKSKQSRIEELEKMLAEKGGDAQAIKQVSELSEERDRLQEELKQYDLIADDIADLKRLRQENAQLKKALEGGSAPVAETEASYERDEEPVEEPVSEPEEPKAKEPVEEEPEAPAEVEAKEEPAAEEEDSEPVRDEEPLAEESSKEEAPSEEAPEAQEKEEAPVEAQAQDADEEEDDDAKSPEDLLSEFEKMLG